MTFVLSYGISDPDFDFEINAVHPIRHNSVVKPLIKYIQVHAAEATKHIEQNHHKLLID